MITKLLLFDNKPDRTGQSIIYPYNSQGLDKTASVLPELLSYLQNLEAGKNQVLSVITALSAHDSFGPNRNGDSFFREDLLREHSYDHVLSAPKGLSCAMHETFPHFARPFKNHVNRPNSPFYGKVLKSFFNPAMDRVELVVAVDKSLAPDIADRLENFGDVGTSMGFKATYDQCLICGNKAKTRAQYCSHARNQMLSVLPDGQIVAVRNPEGYFFDISFVLDPADLTSRAVAVNRLYGKGDEATGGELSLPEDIFLSSDLAKVARFKPHHEDGLSDKTAEEEKEADIVKRIDVDVLPADVEFLKNLQEDLPQMSKQALSELAEGVTPEELLATTSLMGISLSPQEAQYAILSSIGETELAEKLLSEAVVLESDPVSTELGPDDINLKLATKCVAHLESHSHYLPFALNRLEKKASMSLNPYIKRGLSAEPSSVSHIPMDKYDFLKGVDSMQIGRIRYVVGLIAGAKWAIQRREVQRIMENNPDLFNRMMTQAHSQDNSELTLARDWVDQRNRQMAYGNHPNVMLTAPISSIVSGMVPMDKNAGTLEKIFSQSPEIAADERGRYSQFKNISKVANALNYDLDSLEVYGINPRAIALVQHFYEG